MTATATKPTGPLTDEQLNFFRANGFLHIPGLIPAEELKAVQDDTWALIQRGIDERIDDPRYCYGADAEDENRSCLFRINSLINEDASSDPYKILLAYPPLLQVINQAVGGEEFASTVHSCVFKVPHRGYPVPWHQDPVNVRRFPVFNVDIYLDEATTDNGCLYVIPGSHLAGYQPDVKWLESFTEGKAEDAPGAIAVPTKPGDVLFHSTTVLHGSYWNRSNSLRRTIYFHIDHRKEMQLRDNATDLLPWYDANRRLTEQAVETRKAAYPNEVAFEL